MNLLHRWYCNSRVWAKRMHGEYLPGVLRGIELGDDVLEIGPGPGVATEWLRTRVARLTSIEIDRKLARSLEQRMSGTNVTVIEGDATSMRLADASFDTVLSFTMLHHVPSGSQDALLAEACRVLRPGGTFAGMDSTPSFGWNLFHLFDDRYPVDPETFATRLESAGFANARVHTLPGAFSWRARKS